MMNHEHKLLLIILLPCVSFLSIICFIICCLRRRRRKSDHFSCSDMESTLECGGGDGLVNCWELIKFQGAEDLSVEKILDAPGEVIGKSCCGTLYRACVLNSNSLTMLRFLRPTCTLDLKEIVPIVQHLGLVRHPNLVPLCAFYAGPRGEKLMVHPFYASGNLAQFIRGDNPEARKWSAICGISISIARGIHHLHTAFQKPIIHGNLKSKNVLLDPHLNPYISDFSLHLMLNSTARQQMLQMLTSQGYRAPELIKMKDASQETDIYSLGLIFLELLTGKQPFYKGSTPDQDFYLPNSLRSLVLNDRVTDLYHPDILVGLSNDVKVATQDRILRYFKLAMACCSPSRLLRPNIELILRKLEEICNCEHILGR